MADVIGTGSIPRLMQLGVAKVFGDDLNEHKTCWPKMFSTESSDRNYVVDVQLEGFSRSSTKTEGDDITFDSRAQGFSPKYVHSTLAKGFIVTEEALDDEQYGQLKSGAQALARAMRIGKEIDGANEFNNGFDSNFTMTDGDGAALFNTAHSSGNSGLTYSNRLAVDADLSEATLEDAIAIASSMDDDRGLPAALKTKLLVVAAGVAQFNVQRILGSVLRSNSADHDTNAVKDLNSLPDGFMVNPYFTDLDAWFLITDAPNGLKYYTRRAIRFGQDNSFPSGNARFKADERYVFGWTDARGAIGSQGN